MIFTFAFIDFKSLNEQQRCNFKLRGNYTKYRVFQKKLCFTFLLISQLILIVERRVGYPQNWDGKRFRLDFLRYLVHEKIDILGEILTLIERTITPLHVHGF